MTCPINLSFCSVFDLHRVENVYYKCLTIFLGRHTLIAFNRSRINIRFISDKYVISALPDVRTNISDVDSSYRLHISYTFCVIAVIAVTLYIICTIVRQRRAKRTQSKIYSSHMNSNRYSNRES